MGIGPRLKRLETIVAGNGEPGRKTFGQVMADLEADMLAVSAWLAEHGYGNALEAVAAGESGPELRTDGWSLATWAELERDTVDERILAGAYPDVPLWAHGKTRQWCAAVGGRLVYLGPRDDHAGAAARYRALKATPANGVAR
jgi:hypothetical protein